MQTIVCPVDFSACSENAVRYAAAIAAPFNARLILLYVYDSPVAFALDPTVTSVMDKNTRVQAEKNLEQLRARLTEGNHAFKADLMIKEGRAAATIGKIAFEEHADMIIMGSTGKNKAREVLMGSTASHVVSHASCPVLCIPQEAKYEGIQKIVFATDMKDDNLTAALAIVTFARKFNAEIVFVFVDQQHDVISDEYVAELTKTIRTKVNYNKMSGYISKSKNIPDGIRFFLQHYHADMLVMLTHQKHFPERLIHPSVTTGVLKEIKVPLLALTYPDVSLAGAA